MDSSGKISRRKFVSHGCGLLLSFYPYHIDGTSSLFASQNKLVQIHLAGGNDWLNTIIPYQSVHYYKARPKLAILQNAVLPLNNDLAFHPAMDGMKKLYDQGKVEILLNIGPADCDLSHHRAIEMWQHEWQDQYKKLASKNRSNHLIFPAINIEPSLPEKEQIVISSLSPDNGYMFNVDIHYRIPRKDTAEEAPLTAPKLNRNSFAQGLDLIAGMIKQKCNATIYNISIGGFDTHSNQSIKHGYVLQMLSEAIFSFQRRLEEENLANKVLTLVYSEFGRSLKENSDGGTDHGLTNHALIIGNSIRGGIYGSHDCSIEQNLFQPQFDFRQLYAGLF